MKFEKLTIWTCTETYGLSSPGLTALDYVIPVLNGMESECQVLGYDSEDYTLTPTVLNDGAKRVELDAASASE